MQKARPGGRRRIELSVRRNQNYTITTPFLHQKQGGRKMNSRIHSHLQLSCIPTGAILCLGGASSASPLGPGSAHLPETFPFLYLFYRPRLDASRRSPTETDHSELSTLN